MDEQPLFDNFWKYRRSTRTATGSTIWLIDASGNPGVEDTTTIDACWRLGNGRGRGHGLGLGAGRSKMGRAREFELRTIRHWRKSQITRIWNSEVDHSGINLINAGDSWGTTFAWNPSYFAPNEYRLFAKLDTANTAGWTSIIDKGYPVLAASQNASTGLFPAWTNASGAATPPWSGGPTNYQYDAARVPFRIGLDYCDNADSRAKTILSKTSSFFSNLGPLPSWMATASRARQLPRTRHLPACSPLYSSAQPASEP